MYFMFIYTYREVVLIVSYLLLSIVKEILSTYLCSRKILND